MMKIRSLVQKMYQGKTISFVETRDGIIGLILDDGKEKVKDINLQQIM